MFRKEDAEDFLEISTEQKRFHLYFLYLYHINYINEPTENKAIIREYYERELRYRGSFYKDAKVFKERGNPLDWEVKQVTRYKTEDRELKYYTGMNTYDSFVYPTQTLVEIELSKRINLTLLDRQRRITFYNSAFQTQVKSEIKNLTNVMKQLDNKTETVLIKKGFNQPKIYNLSDLQVIFKIYVDRQYYRFISTPFMPKRFLEDKAVNLLENYLMNATKLLREQGGVEDEKYKEYDEDFDIQHCELERIYLVKRSNIYDSLVSRRFLRGYDLEIRNLTSIKIQEVYPSG